MRWDQTEFLLKGIYVGVFVLVGLHNPTWESVGLVAACMAGGLALALIAAAIHKMREGYKVRGHLAGFVLFLLLENPGLVYLGIIAGLVFGANFDLRARLDDFDKVDARFYYSVLGGPVLGLIFWNVRNVADRKMRQWLGLALAALLIGAPLAYFFVEDIDLDQKHAMIYGALALIAVIGFYVLTFASLVEESEVEIGALCAGLGLAIWALGRPYSPNIAVLAVVVPLSVYYLYTRRILPGLRIFKHALRGMSYNQVGQYRLALASLNRALQLAPDHRLAREQLWDLHRTLKIEDAQKDPEIYKLINYNFCLDRVAQLLLQDHPQPPHIDEALRLLQMISTNRVDLEPCCQYWRAVAFCHQRKPDDAVANLQALLEAPQQDSQPRRSVLFQGWQLAMMLHPEMQRRVAGPLLKFSDRRMEAIAAVERVLAVRPEDPAALDMRPFLYADLREADYDAVVPPGQAAADFSHIHVRELGQALLDNADQWPRGCEYLRLAARGLPEQAATLFIQIAKAHEKHGDTVGMWQNYQHAMQIGRAIGAANLAADDRKQFFGVVKAIGDRAMAEDQLDTALDAYKYLSQSDTAGIETWRTLAELFERKKDVWHGLHCTEHALSYNEADPDLLARKDRFYYSIEPADLKARFESVFRWFDGDYCIKKAQTLIDGYNGDLDLLDWSSHLADLAGVAKPKDIVPRLLRARVKRIKGEVEEATALLEEIRQNRPEKFATDAEENAWYYTHRLLGDYYIDTKPDQAVACFQEFRKSTHAGADTSYKLGRAYENLGDNKRAANCYDEVLMFPEHPLYYEARDAMDRVRRAG